jgi:hypothetical protein
MYLFKMGYSSAQSLFGPSRSLSMTLSSLFLAEKSYLFSAN